MLDGLKPDGYRGVFHDPISRTHARVMEGIVSPLSPPESYYPRGYKELAWELTEAPESRLSLVIPPVAETLAQQRVDRRDTSRRVSPDSG